MGKPVIEWLCMLPDGYRERALKNLKRTDENMLKRNYSFMENAISVAFSWKNSPEGYKFWNIIHHHYGINYPLPPLP